MNRYQKIISGCYKISVFLIPISSFYSIRLIIILSVLSLLLNPKRILQINALLISWDKLLYLLVLLIGLIYSENVRGGLYLLETNFTLLAYLLIYFFGKEIFENELFTTPLSFSIGLLVTSSICLGNAILLFAYSSDPQVFSREKLTGFMHSDPTYFSYYLIFAITFGLYLLYFNQVKKIKDIIVGSLIFFFILLMLTAGNTAFVSILLVLAFFILKFLTEPERTNYKIVVFGLSVIFLFAMFYVSYFGLNSFEGRNYWERFVLWEAAIKATPNLLIGAGTGDYTNVLNDYYRSHNLNQFSLSNYNAHNQFIQTLLSNGILGLMALLIMMIRPIVLSIRHQNPLGVLVFFSFFIYGLTEVFLGRYQGVVFFALMHQSFIAYYHSQSKVLAVKES
jgi:O-antigen ligase